MPILHTETGPSPRRPLEWFIGLRCHVGVAASLQVLHFLVRENERGIRELSAQGRGRLRSDVERRLAQLVST